MDDREFKQTQAQILVICKLLLQMNLPRFIEILRGDQAALPAATPQQSLELAELAEALNQARTRVGQVGRTLDLHDDQPK